MIHSHHEKFLQESGIDISFAEKSDVISVNEYTSKELIGFSAPGLAFPYYDLKDGSLLGYRIKLESPTPTSKYMQARGLELKLFFDKQDIDILKNPNVPLIHVEGEKKALAVSQHLPNRRISAVCVGIPGVWNWTKKSSGDGQVHHELSEVYKGLNLANRVVYFAPDSGFFSNPDENKACKALIDLLFKAGAEVHLVDLRLSEEKKVGPDDYIIKNGFDTFWSACQNPAWIHKKHSLDHIPSNLGPEEAETILKQSVLLNDLQAEYLTKKVAVQAKLPAGKVFKELQKKRIAYRKIISVKLENILIWDAQNTTVAGVMGNIGKTISQNKDYYIDPDTDTLLKEKKGRLERFLTGEKLSIELADEVNFQRLNGKEMSGWRHLPHDICESLLGKLSTYTDLRNLKHYLTTPAYLDGGLITEPGYHKNPQALYVGSRVVPAKDTKHLTKLLSTFPFASEVDHLNAVGALLSIFFRGEFIGRHPMILVAGDDQNLGKTTLVQCMAVIASGNTIRDITYTENEEELEKRFATELLNSDFLFLDNVKAQGVIRNQALEALLTAPSISFRLLGGNTMLNRANNILTFCTVNHARLAADLVVRSLTINLAQKNRDRMSVGDFDPIEYSRNHRNEILSELAGLVDRWIASGSKKVPTKFPKYPAFASVINGVLLEEGLKGFLSNYDQVSAKLDPVTAGLIELAGGQLEEADKKKLRFFHLKSGA